MKKLRKMLGDINGENTKQLMALINTQDLKTVSLWALDCVQDLPYYEHLKALCLDVIEGKEKKSCLKEALKKENANIKQCGFLEEIACRTILTALGVYLTPSKSLGFVFYYASYKTYTTLGLENTKENYDLYASTYIDEVLERLEAVCQKDVLKPLNIDWHC